MKITDALRGEHAVFYAQFEHLEQAVPAADTPEEVARPAALLAAALASHAHLEDEILFGALDPQLGEAGPLAVMRLEHEEIEHGLARLKEARGLSEAKTVALHVVRVARDHFAKEERVLFPMAEQILGAERLTVLGTRWAEARKVVL